jgi:hypothetical protein
MPLRFSVRGTTQWSFLMTFRTPEEYLRRRLSPQQVPLVHDGWAFYNVLVTEIAALRLAASPLPLGPTVLLIAYRAYVCDPDGNSALTLLHADCDHAGVRRAARTLWGLPLRPAAVDVFDDGGGTVQIEIETPSGDARFTVDSRTRPRLTDGSAFATLSDAARFLRPPGRLLLPNPGGRSRALIATRGESAAKNRLVRIVDATCAFFGDEPVVSEICFDIDAGADRWHLERNAPDVR